MGLLVKSEKLPPVVPQKKSVSTSKIPEKKAPVPVPVPVRTNNKTKVVSLAQTKSVGSASFDSFDPVPAVTVEQPSLKSRIRAARKKGIKGDVQDLQYLVEEGPLSFRSFGFFGGFFMILASTLDLIEDVGDFTAISNGITFYLWFSGLLSIQIEGRPFHLQIPVVYSVICEILSPLRFLWGRGFFYFFSGCLQFFLFSKYNMICGSYFMLLGAFSITFGYRASVKLASLRNSISNKADIKFLFHSFDKDRDGFLNHEEFREMLLSLDQYLDFNDYVAALSTVDSDNNQQVSYNDLENWWSSYQQQDLPPGTTILRKISMQRYPSRAHSADHLMA